MASVTRTREAALVRIRLLNGRSTGGCVVTLENLAGTTAGITPVDVPGRELFTDEVLREDPARVTGREGADAAVGCFLVVVVERSGRVDVVVGRIVDGADGK